MFVCTNRCGLRGGSDRILHGFLLQRHHRLVVLLLLRIVHPQPPLDILQQFLEHSRLLRRRLAYGPPIQRLGWPDHRPRRNNQHLDDDQRLIGSSRKRHCQLSDVTKQCLGEHNHRRNVTGVGILRVNRSIVSSHVELVEELLLKKYQ